MTRPRAIPVDPASIDYLGGTGLMDYKPQMVRKRFIEKFRLILWEVEPGEARPLIHAAWRTLTFRERECYRLFVLEGYSHGEIARWEGKHRGTISALVYRAQEKLEKSLVIHLGAYR